MKTEKQIQTILSILAEKRLKVNPRSTLSKNRLLAIDAQIKVLKENLNILVIHREYKVNPTVLNSALDARDWLDERMYDFIYPGNYST